MQRLIKNKSTRQQEVEEVQKDVLSLEGIIIRGEPVGDI